VDRAEENWHEEIGAKRIGPSAKKIGPRRIEARRIEQDRDEVDQCDRGDEDDWNEVGRRQASEIAMMTTTKTRVVIEK
jgi:hypothetical protein